MAQLLKIVISLIGSVLGGIAVYRIARQVTKEAMPMAKNFEMLRDRMDPARRARNAARTQEMIRELDQEVT